jgi:hypothetical protein
MSLNLSVLHSSSSKSCIKFNSFNGCCSSLILQENSWCKPSLFFLLKRYWGKNFQTSRNNKTRPCENKKVD